MARLLKIAFWLSALLFITCWWNYNGLARDLRIDDAVSAEPVQSATHATPFTTDQGGVSYDVRPLFAYDLYGLVVSMRDHNGRYAIHRLWNDNLNIADICVVWGHNARDLNLNALEFWNAEFTCYVRTSSSADWHAFNPAQLSNNHLLSDDADLRRAITNVRIGDQIHITGELAEYSNKSGFHRGSSTTRGDTGNGACETIFVKTFTIIEPMRTLWRMLYTPAWLIALVSAVLWLVGAARGRY